MTAIDENQRLVAILRGITPEEIDAFESMLDRIEKNGLELQRQSEQAKSN